MAVIDHFFAGVCDGPSDLAALLAAGGLERRPVTSKEILRIEPALKGIYYGGFFTPSHASGDIHKFTRGLAAICAKKGADFIQDATVEGFSAGQNYFKVFMSRPDRATNSPSQTTDIDIDVDKIVVCAGVESRRIAAMLGDRINVYPVKGYSITVNLNAPSASELLRKSACWTKKQRESRAGWGWIDFV